MRERERGEKPCAGRSAHATPFLDRVVLHRGLGYSHFLTSHRTPKPKDSNHNAAGRPAGRRVARWYARDPAVYVYCTPWSGLRLSGDVTRDAKTAGGCPYLNPDATLCC